MHTSIAANFALNVHFDTKKASSRRLVAMCVTLILPSVAMVIDKQFQMDQWQMVILMAWQFQRYQSVRSVGFYSHTDIGSVSHRQGYRQCKPYPWLHLEEITKQNCPM